MFPARLLRHSLTLGALLVVACAAPAAEELPSPSAAEKSGGPEGLLVREAATGSKAGESVTKAADAWAAKHDSELRSKTLASIRLGQRRSGRLAGDDPVLPDQSHFDAWTLEVPEPQVVRVEMTSSDFDTYLIVLEGELESPGGVVGENDDADGMNAGLAVPLERGTYTILANSYGAGETGAYYLAVTGEDAAGEGDAVAGRFDRPGTVTGSLREGGATAARGHLYDVWLIRGQAGDRVTAILRSDDFDPYLLVGYGSGLPSAEDVLGQDDDGAGDLNSRIEVTLPESGTYSLVVASFDPGSTGRYSLEMRSTRRSSAGSYPGGGDPDAKYAVVVGIDDYPGGGNDLRGPVADASLMRETLINRFGFAADNIVFLRDSEATREGIANAVVRHLGQAGRDGTAVFFYSGHGTRLEANIGLTGHLDPESDNGVDEALFVHGEGAAGLLLDEEIGFLLQQIEAENTLVIIDACFSGTVTRGNPPYDMPKAVEIQNVAVRQPKTFIANEFDLAFGAGLRGLEEALAAPDRHVLIAASSEDELAWTGGPWPEHPGAVSVFTYYWHKVVNNVPTSTSIRDIHEMVRDSTVAYGRRNQGVEIQTPQLLGPNQNAAIGQYLRNR